MSRLTNPPKERNRSLMTSCPVRRRGDALVEAIFAATIEILAESGYSGLSMEAVALRSHTGKASLYRRWSHKVDLVVDALAYEIDRCSAPLDFTDLRTGLINKMEWMSQAFSGNLGKATAGCISEFTREPKLQEAAELRIISPRREEMMASLQAAAQQGQIRPESISPILPTLAMSFSMHTLTFEGRPPNHEEIVQFVDTVMMPLLQTPQTT
ncbi:MAG: TetR/AcrR family transcriptional regulator [Actinomycetes bacterium]